MTDILINQIQTPDGTIIRSYHPNDFVSHLDKNGKRYSLVGGKSFLGRIDSNDYYELSVLDYDPFEKIRLYWYSHHINNYYLCDLPQDDLDFQISKIPKCDKLYQNCSDDVKYIYVEHVSLLLQERLYRKKFQIYSNKIKELLINYNEEVKFGKLNLFIIERLFENLKDPFYTCRFVLNASKRGNIHYHEIMKLIWEQLSKYEWLKGNEYETERVLNMVLKPLEEK